MNMTVIKAPDPHNFSETLEGLRTLPARKEYEDILFRNCQFGELDWRNRVFVNCTFENCSLTLLQCEGLRWQEVVFYGCKLVGLEFHKTNKLFLSVNFCQTVLLNCNFSGLSLLQTRFLDCNINECYFSETCLRDVDFSGSSLRGTSFHNCDLRRANLREARDYEIDPTSNNLSKARFSFPHVLGLLRGFDIIIDD